jgi:hypothetical protein
MMMQPVSSGSRSASSAARGKWFSAPKALDINLPVP